MESSRKNEMLLKFLERMEKELSAAQKTALEALRIAKESEKEKDKLLKKLYGILEKEAPQVLQTTGRESSQRIIFQGPRPTGKNPA